MGEPRRGFAGDTRGYTGKMNERDMFGEPEFGNKFVEACKARGMTEKGYLPYADAMDLIREFSPEDPTNPSQPFSQELRLAVAEKLGLEKDEDMDRVCVYSAIGTPLDVYHGVDAWIEVISPDGKKRTVVTMDATKNPNKDEWKADLIIPELPDPDFQERLFMAEVGKYARKVTQLIKERQMQQRRMAA